VGYLKSGSALKAKGRKEKGQRKDWVIGPGKGPCLKKSLIVGEKGGRVQKKM